MTLKIVINLGLFDKLPDLLEKNDNFLQLTAVFHTKKNYIIMKKTNNFNLFILKTPIENEAIHKRRF